MLRHLPPAALLPIPALLLPAAAHADEINHGGQIWGSIQVTAPLGDNVFATMDIQPRLSTPNAATAPITIIPPVISYRVNDDLTASGGYLYAYIDGARIFGLHEDRFFQQLGYRIGNIGRVGVRMQTRLEERKRSTGQEWNVRVAQQILLALPLGKEPGAGATAVASTELYWNLSKADWGARKGYDDLWTFLGVQVPLREDVAMEFGYLNQRQRAVNGRANMNHAAVIGVSFQLARRVRPPLVVPTLPGRAF
jgi:Protein of unknown function (DUF2490)